ncbi:response regulator transcription factor [Oceanobacillus arenosus]|uniref:response regulator transcription factor n=1 Tax=Oceanobacillus arenosus TaxID=1229153 RepID=UPI001FE4F7A4|nr:response regulator transcription factor [Oceanobacillus arenosus]
MSHNKILEQVSMLDNTSNHEEKLLKILETYLDLFPLRDAFLYRYSPIGYLCEGVIGLTSSEIVHIREDREDVRSVPVFFSTIKDKKARVYTGIEFMKLMTSNHIFSSNIHSAVVAPLCNGPAFIGFIISYTFVEELTWDEDILASLTFFGKLAGNIISNSTVNEKIRILSKRELEVMRYISWGESTKEIANVMGISELTVKQYVKSSLKKLGVRNRTEAVAALLRKGIIS